jgi:ferrochelatase
MESGGKEYQYIPCLNSDDAHIEMLFNLLQDNLYGWDVEQDMSVRAAEAAKLNAPV